MKQYQKLFSLLFVIILLFSLAACAGLPDSGSPLPETTTDTTPETTEETIPQWSPYKGQSSRGYVYYYESGRNRDWEEDIIYMADNYTWDYAQLTSFDSRIEWPGDVEYSDQFYNEELRETFLAEINALILRIPELTDNEILYELQRIVALLHDAHSSIYLPAADSVAASFQPFYVDGELDVRAVYLPEQYRHVMFGKLTAINGFTVEEVMEKALPYLSYENEYWAVNLMFGIFGPEYAANPEFLQIIGISPKGAEGVTYSFLTEGGQAVDVELYPLSSPKMYGQSMIPGYTCNWVYELMYRDRQDRMYWHEEIAPGTVYIRINEFEEDPNYTFLTLGNEILAQDRDRGGTRKVIVDVRDNPGGYQFLGYGQLITVLQRMDVQNIYVLIDGNTFSNGIIMAGSIKREIPEAIIVGTPGGQPANFFAGMYDGDYVMPNCGVICRIPTAWIVSLPDFEGEALMPDVVVWPTLADYKNHTDTILQAVLRMP